MKVGDITKLLRKFYLVNPYDYKVYTHARMKDGNYTIIVSFDDIDLSTMSAAYHSLGTLYGVGILDEIEVEVNGSLYDDLNN